MKQWLFPNSSGFRKRCFIMLRGKDCRIVRGRLVDWGPLPGHSELVDRTGAALARIHGSKRDPVPAAEVDELRIVWGWLADNEPRELPLDPAPPPEALREFVATAA